MNWLAHFALSSADDLERMGNWLPDLFGSAELAGIGDSRLRRGMDLHRVIDRTTDLHPLHRTALSRLPPALRRGGGILLDVYWDHFLSVDFVRCTGRPLEPFVADVLDSLDRAVVFAPRETRWVLDRMRSENWLGSYGTGAGVELTLTRISRRLSPRVRSVLDPAQSAEYLERNRAVLQSVFEVLWRDVSAAVSAARADLGE